MISGREFKALRESKGLTLKEVANVLHVSEQAINKYELEIVRNIPLEKIELMAHLYGVSPSYIMEWDDSSSSVELSDDEQHLLQMFRSLNPAGKRRALQELDDLTQIERYIKIPTGDGKEVG